MTILFTNGLFFFFACSWAYNSSISGDCKLKMYKRQSTEIFSNHSSKQKEKNKTERKMKEKIC